MSVCERCAAPLESFIARAAQTRCLACDPERDHFSDEPGGACLGCAPSSVGTGITYRPPAPEALCPSPTDPMHCATCPAEISWPDRTGGHLRCSKCDSITQHRAIPDGPGWLPECRYCAATRTSAVSVPAAGTDGTVTPEGEPADAEKAAAFAGTPTGPTSPGPVGDLPEGGAHGRRLSDLEDSPAAELIEPSHAGVPAVGGQTEERIEVMSAEEFEAAVNRQLDALQLTREQLAAMAVDDDWVSLAAKKLWLAIKDTPAAATTSLPDGGGDPTPEPELQPGQDHHQVSGVSPGGVPPEMPSVMAGELGDGGGTSLTPSSSSDPDEWVDPASALMRAFRSFVGTTVMAVDTEAVAGMLTDAEVLDLHLMGEQIADCIERIKHATP